MRVRLHKMCNLATILQHKSKKIYLIQNLIKLDVLSHLFHVKFEVAFIATKNMDYPILGIAF